MAEGALDVYFEETIEVLVHDPDAFSEEGMKKVLEQNEIEFSDIERTSL